MEDRERIAEQFDNGMCDSDRCQFCHEFGEKVEPYLCPDCIEKIKALGYTRPAEPAEDKVEEIAEILAKEAGFFDSRGFKYLSDSVQQVFSEKAREILKLCPAGTNITIGQPKKRPDLIIEREG